MSSIQSNTSPTVASASSPSSESPTSQTCPEQDETTVPSRDGAGLPLLNAVNDVRQIIRLVQCKLCSRILREPTTLPCGESLCKQCIPKTYARTNISWPATTGRLQGFMCPFTECEKEHAIGDCSIDITLNKALALLRAAVEQDRDVTGLSNVSTSITPQDKWRVAGVPRQEEKEDPTKVLKGGRIVSTYTLVETAELEYGIEVTYTSIGVSEDEMSGIDLGVFTRLKESVRTEMDCQVCYALYLDPITTACGHTFCRNCLHRVLDHSVCCPICRRSLSISPQLIPSSFPSNQRLTKMIDGFWADIVALRTQAVRIEQQARLGEFDIPLFVCTLSFPAMSTFLHVFEPRYRLMIRRAMEGDRTFGMVLHKQSTEPEGPHFSAIGTLLRIASIEYFSDGRSLLETVGVSRFRVTHHGWLDGYVVAKIEKIDDISLAEEEDMEITETRRGHGIQDFAAQATEANDYSQSRLAVRSRQRGLAVADLESMATRELVEIGVDFVRRMRAQSVDWLTTRALTVYGECPEDPAAFPWWLASVLPVNDDEKYRLLGTTSVRQRMKTCCRWIVEWESNRW